MAGSTVGIFAIVSHSADPLAAALETALRARRLKCIRIHLPLLASTPVELTGESFRVHGEPVAGVLFRGTSDSFFSSEFCEEDQRFSDLEVSATWLAALQLPTLLAVNRLDAAAWFENTWALWRRRLQARGVRLSTFRVGGGHDGGGKWQPYLGRIRRCRLDQSGSAVLGAAVTETPGVTEWYFAAGRVLKPDPPAPLRDAVARLDTSGILFGSVTVDQNGSVITVDTNPVVPDDDVAQRAAEVLCDRIQAHMLSR